MRLGWFILRRLLADFESINNHLANLQLLDAAFTNRKFANRERAHGHCPHRHRSYSSSASRDRK